MAELLEGKKIKAEIAEELKKTLTALNTKLTLAIIQIGNREDSTAYIKAKKKFAKEIGVEVNHIELPNDVTTKEVLEKIHQLNGDTSVEGIIVQLPLPMTLDKDILLNSIDPKKDVDGLCALNIAHLWQGRETAVVPATTRGILTMLKYYNIPLEGKKVVMVGRSTLVGKPTAFACMNQNATVTVCHSKTENLAEETKKADILIVAIGKPQFITKDHVKEGQIVIDVGINSRELGKLDDEIMLPKLIGDVDYNEVKKIVHAITPVPGGVGQLTVVSLFQNLVDVYKRRHMGIK